MLPDCARISLCLRRDCVLISDFFFYRFLLQSFFIENDLECFDEQSEHIHIRNAGILDELGHITLLSLMIVI